MKSKKKFKIKIKADPSKLRRVWTVKPAQKVKPGDLRSRLSRIRERELREDDGR